MGQSGIAIPASYPQENSEKTGEARQISDQGLFCAISHFSAGLDSLV
jgi:hypothetical protein